jgi:DegV family protein with EDD domain
MNPVVIFSDSTIDLTAADYKHYQIQVVPLIVNLEGKDYLDGVTITPDQIYASVEKTGHLPATAAVGPERLKEAYEPWIQKGYDVVFVGIGASLSGTVQASHIAGAEFPDGRVYTCDSQNLSSASGLLAIKACALRDQGKSAAEIAAAIAEMAPRVSAQFGVERLDYLNKGGRCSSLALVMGTLLHIHPVLKVVDGKLIIYKKPRGRSEAFYDEMLGIIKADMPHVDQDVVMVTHAGIGEEAIDYIVSRLGKMVNPKCIHVTRAGAVISSHCGFGTIGILYLKTK